MQKNFYIRNFKGRELLRVNLGAAVGVVLALIVAVCCVVALSGCQAIQAKESAAKATAALEDADGAFDAVDGTAVALEAGKVQPKAAAKDLHASVKTGKGAVATAKDGTAELVAALDKQTKRADGAEAALADRARNRIEWSFIAGGFILTGLAVWLAWQLFAGGSLTLVEAAASPKSVIRKGAFALGLFCLGCACFWTACNLDNILTVGKWTALVLVLLSVAAIIFHQRKHLILTKKKLAAK